jgi:hypothetical protein
MNKICGDVKMNKIKQFTCRTREGNTLVFFYNPENDLIVIDLVDKSENGGNEIYRRMINESELLEGVQ